MHRKTKAKSYRQHVHCIISLGIVACGIDTLIVVTVMRTLPHQAFEDQQDTEEVEDELDNMNVFRDSIALALFYRN